MLNTYAIWALIDDYDMAAPKINAEYHYGLTLAMNHGYDSYRSGRIALLIFSRIYDSGLRQNARKILVKALENNPHMMDVWMKLIHDVTKSTDIPVEGQNIIKRIPDKCPNFDDSYRERLEVLLHKHIKSYEQMYLEILLRLLSPPSCCSINQPKYLKTLKTAWIDRNQNQALRGYLFDAYLSCITKSSSIEEILNLIEREILSTNILPELDSFKELLNTLSLVLESKSNEEIEDHKTNLTDFFVTLCDVFPRIQVTASTWVIAPHYRACKEMQLEILNSLGSEQCKIVSDDWIVLNEMSDKTTKTWNKFYLNGLLYGRTGDIIPLLVGVKKSVGNGLIHETAGTVNF